VDAHLLLKDPKLDVSVPYAYADVCKIAEELLCRDRFDLEEKEFLGMKSPLEPRKSTSIFDHHDPGDDPICPLLSPSDARANLRALDQERVIAKEKDDVETLVHKLSRLTLSEPDYAFYYFCAIKLDPDIGKVFPCPVIPTQAPTPAPTTVTTPTHPTRPAVCPPITCYGCSVEGHGLNRCEAINDLVTKGSLARDEMGRITLPNGQRLFRNGEETILQAYERHAAAARAANTVHFITHDEEDLQTKIYELEEEEPLVATVDRVPRVTKEKRKVTFEGVIIPPYGKGKGKENRSHYQSSHHHQSCLQ